MVSRLLAAIKRQPRSHRAILLRDGWMKEWDSYETIQTGPAEGRWPALAHVNARVASIAVSALPHHTGGRTLDPKREEKSRLSNKKEVHRFKWTKLTVKCLDAVFHLIVFLLF